MYLYEPLRRHLAAQSAATVSMSYGEIERVLNRPLPPSSRGDIRRQWWANTESHSQAKAWLGAGRRAKLDTANDMIVFTKVRGADHAASDTDIRLARGDLHPAAIRLIEDLAEEQEVGLSEAVTVLLNQAALHRRRETIDWFARHTTHSPVTSADLIRADRDGR